MQDRKTYHLIRLARKCLTVTEFIDSIVSWPKFYIGPTRLRWTKKDFIQFYEDSRRMYDKIV